MLLQFVRGLDDDKLKGLHRVCKTRGYAFFRDPKNVIVLRKEIERREKLNHKRRMRELLKVVR